ncbi:Dock homology region 2 domain containing protein [Nitzschia inconspicua]|uniref:Dock homology region 2 domain containing protein n=1 Tax=Nitzschia inconspicua TaxID=303405 RepID=A0A9K3Q882_9STRA|nr:Dock homology region 2 domain containing protein [Nitzschia inconspicua]
MPQPNPNDSGRQQEEINAFAAMANGDFDFAAALGNAGENATGTFDFSSNQKKDDAANDIQSFGALARGEASVDDDDKASFGKLAQQPLNSRTFSKFDAIGASNSLKNVTNPLRDSNLEAAALALDMEDRPSALNNRQRSVSVAAAGANFPGIAAANSFGTFANNSDKGGIGGPATKNVKIANQSPMHTQRVTLPRPLFFGPNLPPRVVKDAKQIVRKALAEQRAILQEGDSNNNKKRPSAGIRVGQLPPPVRNLVSAIECYGYGIDIVEGNEDETKDDVVVYQGSPFLSVYCPKWSGMEDLQRPALLQTRSTTENTNLSGTDYGDGSTNEGSEGEEDLNESFRAVARASGFLTDTAESTQEQQPLSHQQGAGQPSSSFPFSVLDGDDDGLVILNKNHTATTGTMTTANASSLGSSNMSERDMFSLFARRGSSDESGSGTGPTTPRGSVASPGVGGGASHRGSLTLEQSLNNSGGNLNAPPMTDQEIFTQWVQQSPANVVTNPNSNSTGTVNFTETAGNNSFFRASSNFIAPTMSDDSDDDSVVGSEMIKKVGVSEHLHAALASLEEQNSNDDAGAGNGGDDAAEMTHVPLTQDGGRPLSNHELLDGHAPLFGIDDPPLPSESDLGSHETREEQQKSKEQRRIQTIIEKCCPQNVFGPLACPNPATSPDDNHSWNSKSTPLQRHLSNMDSSSNIGRVKSGMSTASGKSNTKMQDDSSAATTSSGKSGKRGVPFQELVTAKVYDPRTRFGWWNKGSEEGEETKGDPVNVVETNSDDEVPEEPPIQLPPWEHAAKTTLIRTPLSPTPEKLHEQNRPLSELHPATSLAQALPFVSDRPPSYRYLQVDTQTVSFPALGGEAEPLFCSLAIYHVETVAQTVADRGMSPVPDLQRCGKVTETLNFDVVNDPDVERRCRGSLCPYSSRNDAEITVGTRCGVFPLPSNLSVHHLYVIMTVSKVISEGTDFEPYLRPKSSTGDKFDIETLRAKAAKAAENHGKFLIPFAFGVAPLLQVFGADILRIPSSRAVQIPLFRFNAGLGDRQIIDHIMVMLYPKADHRASGVGGPAPVTNGGTAMLVMRSFGYLGLHEVVSSKSSLARDRLVDFTGEIQLRRREDVTGEESTGSFQSSELPHTQVPWRNQFVAEATKHGGRCLEESRNNTIEVSTSILYAQELAPLPLLSTPLGRPSISPSFPKSRGRGNSSGEDIEPYFHTTFCNEIVCNPRLLHNCPKGNIVVKVEMREMEWSPDHNAFFAHTPSCGPVVHNPRRGSFLIQGAYTSCSVRCSDPHFLDEFKMKLPLVLESNGQRSHCIFFTVFRLSFSSRKKWSRRLLSTKRSSRKVDEIAGVLVGESGEVSNESKDCHLIQLGCGILPVEKQQALLENGNHDVKIAFCARKLLPSFCEKEGMNPDTILVSESLEGKLDQGPNEDNATEEGGSQGSGRHFLDTASAASHSERETFSDSVDESKMKVSRRPSAILLQVRVSVQSSLHSQNPTLNEFLSQDPDVSLPLKATGSKMEAFLRQGKEEIVRRLNASLASAPSEHHQYEAKRLMISTVDIAKSDMCSVSDISTHLLRVAKQLWKITIVGTGNHDLEWANPASTLPLRVNAFATLLQILGSSTLYMSKRGVTQLDGSSKWNFVALGRVLSLLFDEEKMFGIHGEEAISEDLLARFSGSRREDTKVQNIKKRSKRHVRSNFEFFNNGAAGGGTESLGAVSEGEMVNSSPDRRSSASDLVAVPRPESSDDDSSPLLTLERRDRQNLEDDTPKVDSLADFRSALHAGTRDGEFDDGIHKGQFTGNTAADSWIKAFGGSSGGASRRWMTAPSPGLATIREDGGVDEEEDEVDGDTASKLVGPLDQLSSEIRPSKNPVRQFRVPKRSKNSSSTSGEKLDEGAGNDSKGPFPPSGEELAFTLTPPKLLPVHSLDKKEDSREKAKKRGQTLPTTDADMINAGSSFLDAIEKSLGLSAFAQGGEEEERVFGKHHRKTISHSSIDWSIPNDDLSTLLIESRHGKKPAVPSESIEKFDESMGTLEQEMNLCLKLPSFVDRLAALGNSEVKHGRWFPFAYEVIIMQWVAILLEQQPLMDSSRDLRSHDANTEVNETLAEASSRTSGAIIACAPVLFEVIKQSLGARVGMLVRRFAGRTRHFYPPLVTLDDSMMANLEQLIAIITDACLDSRNFDAWETLQNCVDVNDSIVCFLRDMFAFIDPACVHRLTMVYWSRLVARDGRQWQDRDSNIGLRVSWEITKLQMNAVSAFVRFHDLIRINSPQMNNWSDWWTSAPAWSMVAFFDEVVDRYENFGLPSIVTDPTSQCRTEFPRMRPHWLVEIIVDICLAGIEHAEQNIQRRSSSLLLEMFWSQAQKSLREGYCPVVASMYITFIEKVATRTNYLATCFSAKSQVRQDLILCVVFVLQSAPHGLLRALWRKLFSRSPGKGQLEKYGGTIPKATDRIRDVNESELSGKSLRMDAAGPDIFDMFGLLNVCLSTVEYEGCDEHAEVDGRNDTDGPIGYWRKEFLLTRGRDTNDAARRRRLMSYGKPAKNEKDGSSEENDYATTSSRKWLSHDASIVLIRTAQQIVREFRFVLEPTEGSQSLFNPARRKARIDQSKMYRSSVSSMDSNGVSGNEADMNFSYTDTVIFVRGATSVYLNSLVLRESDIALVKTLNAAVEIIKIFGIKIFNEAVGETLQHWLRMITFHCGSRRAEVRIPASDFMELILRSTWDCFGSFFRIMIPLLAVQTEVMERIVATAIARHYRDQRKIGKGIDLFSNASAEASLTPLWRTTDRLHHQSASQNVAFRSSLVRLAEKLKKLHRAYIAAHALSFQSRSRNRQHIGDSDPNAPKSIESETLVRANRISVIRVVNTSAGYSKQFLGIHGVSREHASLAHHEAVEDAFLDAADVFSPTELPDHRVAWLRKLAQFHASRNKSAEEATCHYMIYFTLNRSSRLSGSLWSSSPFLPWIDNMSDGIHLEGPAGDPDDGSEFEMPELDYGHQIDKTNSFRRIFYRNENSIRLNAGELEGDSKTPFFGVSLTSEYLRTTPWISMKEMEANMLEEAEAAGDLFKKAGVIVSSRYMWSLAAQYFADKYMYGKLAQIYERLARTIVVQIPTIDSTLQQEVNIGIPIGRFYRVWFHGGAPDELIGAEFVYRTATNTTLSKFGKELRDVIRCIIPENTPIHLVLDGRSEESLQPSFNRMGGTPLEPVRVKVTPLRPVVENAIRIRGLPEWFKLYIEAAFSGQTSRSWQTNGNINHPSKKDPVRSRYHHTRSYSAYHSSSGSMSVHNTSSRNGYSGNDHRHIKVDSALEGELVGADKFWFIQPINKERSQGSRDWLKSSTGDFAEKTLRVTQLQVGQSFPACVSRQTVVHRIVFTQSPLEAAVDNMCQWCAVLFRTAIASNGIAVLGVSADPGIGIDAAKVVSECMHTSRVKEIGLLLRRKNANIEEEDDDVMQSYDRLSDDEIKKYQLKLARSLVVFMELLHLLISRNRDLLLDVIQTRKKAEGGRHSRDISMGSFGPSAKNRTMAADVSLPGTLGGSGDRSRQGDQGHRRNGSGTNESVASSQDDRSREDMSTSKRLSNADEYASVYSNKRQQSVVTVSEDYSGNTIMSLRDPATERVRTDSAIGIQRELQLAFINLAKDLFPMIYGIMESDTPRWLKQCCQDNYFSAYTYRGAKIPIGEELTFEDVNISSIGSDDVGFGDPKYSQIMRYGGTTSGERLGLIPSLSRSDRSHSQQSSHGQPPLSPGGSIGSSSVHSKGSDAGRSVRSAFSGRSLKELKHPIERLASC